MNKKTIKIMTIILTIGISIPVIVAGTSSQEHIMALFSPNELSMNNKKVQSNMFFTEDSTVELDKVERISEDDFTIRGKWGIYDNNMEGIFRGFQEENKIYGKVVYNNEKVYFYLQMNKYLKTFSGVVIYKNNFYSLNGNYIEKNERFIALWTCENVNGWLTGEML